MKNQNSQEKLTGIINRITFHGDETGWSVLKVSPLESPKKEVTIILHQAKVFAGASMDFYGFWTTHPKFGRQFKANKALERKPATTAAIEKYLGSGLIKGVGPKTAKKIVRHFGPRTLSIFEESIEELLHVPSIAQKKLLQIRTSWEEHKSISDIMIFLQSYGISALLAVKIFKFYKKKAIEKISENPYCLARDIYGIGFFSADKIALSMGIHKEAPQRIEAAIRSLLDSSREEGHCYLLKEQILLKTKNLLNLENMILIEKSLSSLHQANDIKKRNLLADGKPLECYYSNTLYRDENDVAKSVKEILATPINVDLSRVNKWINRYCEKFELSLSQEQKESIAQIVTKPFSILTGGPGCGKTTTTKVLVKLLLSMNKKVTLAAPTGRAAQRMTEVIGLQAKTIHRLLEWNPQNGGFKKNKSDPLDSHFLIIDESSMLDISIASSLFRALPKNCQVLLIGDPDQLPSVGAGSVLEDLLSSSKIPHYKLTKIFRQAQESLIIKYAHEINKGVIPQIQSPICKKEIWDKPIDCLFIDSEEATQEQIQFISRVKKSVKEDISPQKLTLPEKFSHVDRLKLTQAQTRAQELKEVLKNIHPWSTLHYGMSATDSILRLYTQTIRKKLGAKCEIQILTPQIRGSLGTENLNNKIQNAINPLRQGMLQIKSGERLFRVNDRVIQTRNNYDLNVFNGDIGQISSLNLEENTAEVLFSLESGPILYKREDLMELKLAYAITIHKSQGSEFEAVIIPITTQHFKMLFRNLIYTGLTRAKKLVIFIGTRKALTMAIKSIDNRKRQTALKNLLQF